MCFVVLVLSSIELGKPDESVAYDASISHRLKRKITVFG